MNSHAPDFCRTTSVRKNEMTMMRQPQLSGEQEENDKILTATLRRHILSSTPVFQIRQTRVPESYPLVIEVSKGLC